MFTRRATFELLLRGVRPLLVLSAGLLLLLAAPPAGADGPEPGVPRDTILWSNPEGGDWYDPANWTPANVPDTPWEAAVMKPLSGGYVVTLGANATIGGLRVDPGLALTLSEGTLQIFGIPLNRGTIRISDGGTLRQHYPLLQNRGGTIVSGPGGGSLLVVGPYPESPGTIDNTLNGSTSADAGKLKTDGGDLVVYCGALLNGEIQRTAGDTSAVRIQIATPQNLTVAAGALVRVDGQIDLMAAGSSLINHGTVRVPGRINAGCCIGSPGNWVSLSGDGEIILEEGIIDTPSGASLINAAGHTIRGCGTILANMTNYGTIESDCPYSALKMTSPAENWNELKAARGFLWITGPVAHVTNPGSISAEGGLIWIDGGASIDNRQGVIAANGRPIEIGRGSSCTIEGGLLDGTGGQMFHNQGTVTLKDVTVGPGAALRTWSGGTTIATGASLLNQGTLRIDAQGMLAVGATTDYIQTGGTTVLAGGSLTATREVQIQGGALRGIGTITADVTSSGQVSPDATPGALTIQGDYRQLTGGSLNVALAGPGAGQISRLAVTGEAYLDGPLEVAAIGGYDPIPQTPFEVLSYGSVSGQFSECVGNGPLGELDLVSLYGTDGLDLMILGAVGVDGPRVPAVLRFHGTRAAGEASFVLDLPGEAVVTVRAYDAGGREVARLADGVWPAGTHRFPLGGAGPALSSGVYFARAQVRIGAQVETRTARVAILR